MSLKNPIKRTRTARMGGTYPKVIGKMKDHELALKLQAMSEVPLTKGLRDRLGIGATRKERVSSSWPWDAKPPAWKYTGHAFGYLPKARRASVPMMEITDAGNIQADMNLRNAEIKVTLDRLRVFEYPGRGLHTILFDFYAQHQADSAGHAQDLHFNHNYRIQQGSGAGITGYPVFVGLKVGEEGVSFRCYTVNVSNDDDKRILAFLDDDVFKKGLSLMNTINPMAPVVSGFATGIIKAFATRNNNVPVQDFYMGLDFSGIQTRAQLREGSYVAVQVEDAAIWDWSEWAYKPSNGQIVSRKSGNAVPLNYIIFSVSRMLSGVHIRH